MSKPLAMLGIGLLLGGLAGFVAAAGNGITLDGHDHATDHGGHGASATHDSAGHEAMHAELLDLPADQPSPALDLSVRPDPVTGWNLHVITRNFRFAPENASIANLPGEGHAHIYVNGTKIARLYGPWFHIGDLPEGENRIRVTLNANDHRQLAVGGKALEAETVVTVR